MNEGRRIAQEKISRSPQAPAQLPVPSELRQIKRETNRGSLEAPFAEVLLDLRGLAIMLKPLPQDPVICRVTVTDVRAAFAVAQEREDPKITAMFEIEEEDQTFRGVRN